jgi:capsular polysaccharide biosynthesis protein
MNLKTFLGTVRLYWMTFVLVAAAVLAAGLAWLLLMPVKYVSSTQLLVSIQGSTTATAYQNADVVYGRVNSYITLLTSDVLSQRVVDKLKLPMKASDLAAKISATEVPPKTSIIDVAVTGDSPAQAQQLASTVAAEFISYVDALETPTGDDNQKVHTTVVTEASQPQRRTTELLLVAGLLAIGAVVVGAVAVWIRWLIDPVVRTADRAQSAGGVPVLGHVSSAAACTAEALLGYRGLRTKLGAVTTAGGALEITSVDDKTDVSPVANNLGRALELAGGRTIVLDIASKPIRGKPPVRGREGYPDTLSGYAWAENPDRAATTAASGLIKTLRADYQHVVLAAPPALSSLTASVVSEYVDAVVLLISQGKSLRREVARATERLTATGASLAGLVLVTKDHDHEPAKD